MKNISIMIKPASSLCNLRCNYCFYANVTSLREVRSFGIMQEETVDRMLSNIHRGLSSGDRITFAFQGGEPTLAGLLFFRYFTNSVEKWDGIEVSYALQTNAVLLDEEWCEFLKEKGFLVGVSLDLHKASHNHGRVDAGGQGTYSRVMEAVALLKKSEVEFNVLCTLTNEVAQYPDKVWKLIQKQDFHYVQFTPCLGDLNSSVSGIYALKPERFASFYRQIFSYWLADFKQGKYRSIKLFDDIVHLMVTGQPVSCGLDGICQPQLVVEGDGSVYPCDFYCLDEYCLGNLTEDSLDTVFIKSVHSPSKERMPLPSMCADCPYRKLCGGGCKRMRKEVFCGDGAGICGYRTFLDSCVRELYGIAQQEAYYQRHKCSLL